MDIACNARRTFDLKCRYPGVTQRFQRLIGTAMVLCLAMLSASPGYAAGQPPNGETPKAPDVADWSDVPDFVARLKRGGMVLYFRHAATDRTQTDQRPIDLSDCANQRNLSEKGRRQSQVIGEAIRALGIPIGPVLSSPFCRTVETAKLAFGHSEKSDMLYFAIGISAADKSKAVAALRKMLSEAPPPGKNRIVVSHTANLKDATGIWPKPEGAAFVFEPRGTDGFRVVTRVAPEDWGQIVARSKRPE